MHSLGGSEKLLAKQTIIPTISNKKLYSGGSKFDCMFVFHRILSIKSSLNEWLFLKVVQNSLIHVPYFVFMLTEPKPMQ